MPKKKSNKYNPQFLFEEDGSDNSKVKELINFYRSVASLPTGSSSSRQNAAYSGLMGGKFDAIANDFITPKNAIILAYMFYHSFGMVRNAIDTMCEFTLNGVDFISNKKASREAMLGWSEGINLKDTLDQISLEYYRSGNVYIYRLESVIKDSSFNVLSKTFGIAGNTKIPTGYLIIDPRNVEFVGGGLFSQNYYQMVIPASEVKLLIQKYQGDSKFAMSLPTEFAEAIKNFLGKGKKAGDVLVKINPDNFIVLHRKKQTYEPYAMPFLRSAFDDLDFYKELRNMDKALARVISRILIHVAVGDSNNIPSPEALGAIREKLSNPSTSTYLVTDGMVKINEYYPDIGQMLDPKKYEAVKEDIRTALGITSAAYGDGNGGFSTNFLGIKIFLERIIDGRSKITQFFLESEVRRVAKALNLKAQITPELTGPNLEDDKEWAKIYSRLYEDGVLSPQSVIESIRDRRFPTFDEEVERQRETVTLKDEGLFQPSANRGGDSQQSGRPSGKSNNSPQSSLKDASPAGARSISSELLSKTDEYVRSILSKNFDIKTYSKSQEDFINDFCKDFLSKNEFSKSKIKSSLEVLIKKTKNV